MEITQILEIILGTDVSYAAVPIGAILSGVNLVSGAMGKGGGKGGGGKSNIAEAASLGVMGAVKGIQAKIKEKKAERAEPAMVDPTEEMARLAAKRRLRAAQTGTATERQRKALQQMMGQGMANVFRAGGGVKGLNKLKDMFLQGMLGVGQQSQQLEQYYADVYGKATQRRGQRMLELGLAKQSKLEAQGAQLRKEAKSAGNLALAKSLPVGNEGGSSAFNFANILNQQPAADTEVDNQVAGVVE